MKESVEQKKKLCSWCLIEKTSDIISYCTCGEASNVCHPCLQQGIATLTNKKLLKICSICREKELQNLPYRCSTSLFHFYLFNLQTSVQISNETDNFRNPENLNQNSSPEQVNELFDYQYLKKKIYRMSIWLIVFLIISWMFAPFSYFIVFRMKNTKNYFGKFYITLSTGTIFGFPITIFSRNIIRRYCLPED